MRRLLLADGEWMIFEWSSTSSPDRLWGRRKCVLVATCQAAGDAYCICWKGEFSKREAFWKASSHSDSWSQTRKKAQRGVQCQSVPRRRLASPRGLGTGDLRGQEGDWVEKGRLWETEGKQENRPQWWGAAPLLGELCLRRPVRSSRSSALQLRTCSGPNVICIGENEKVSSSSSSCLGH